RETDIHPALAERAVDAVQHTAVVAHAVADCTFPKAAARRPDDVDAVLGEKHLFEPVLDAGEELRERLAAVPDHPLALSVEDFTANFDRAWQHQPDVIVVGHMAPSGCGISSVAEVDVSFNFHC